MSKKDEALRLALEALEWIAAQRTGGMIQHKASEPINAICEALAEQPAQQQDYWQEEARRYSQNADFWRSKYEAAIAQEQEPVACRDEMCACRGGPCASCPDGEREKELADVRASRDFHKRRTDELQKAQSQMRDPERTMVCDILANGRLLVPAGGRYSTSSPAQQQEPVATVIQFDGEKIIDASMEFFDKYPIGTELYTSPPASKPWVGLTDEQRRYVVEMWKGGNWTAGDIIDAVEAAHGITGEQHG